jgi:peptide-methionine (S)-S-oxide reductase
MKTIWMAALALLLCGASTRAALAKTEHVVLAGGCFWGMQAVFSPLRGVERVTAGYSGGSAESANYDTVSTGTTGHAESIDVVYDPSKISFKQLLDVYFFVAHDPTQAGGQGADIGPQYRSEIFTTTTEQAREANAEIHDLDVSHAFPKPIVTKVEPFHAFYAAEGYHQNYVARNPDNPYVIFVDKPKLRHLRERYGNLLKS